MISRFVFKARSVVLVASLPALLCFFVAGTNRVRGEETTQQLELKERISIFEKATDIILMIIPPKMFFVIDIKVDMLPRIACIYNIHDNELANKKIISILSDGIFIDNSSHAGAMDLRVGIVFKKDSDTIGKIYFSDHAENGEVLGLFDGRRVRMRADKLNAIRALPVETGAALTDRHQIYCK